MGQKEKLIQRLKSNPKDFIFDEAESLLKYFDYECSIKAKQAVPVLSFPGNELKSYQVKQLITLLTEEGLI